MAIIAEDIQNLELSLGRFVFAALNNLTVDDLVRILREPKKLWLNNTRLPLVL